MKRFLFLLLAGLMLSVSSGRGAEADDDYLRVFTLIEQADSLNANGQAGSAEAKYRQAYNELLALKRNYPTWNTKMVAYRMSYLTEKLTGNKPTDSASGSNSTAASTAPKSGSAVARDVQVKLVEPGGEPRKVMRFQPRVGDKQAMTMNMAMAMEIKMAGNEAPAVKLPPMKISVEILVKEVSPQGDITYQVAVADAQVAEGDAPPEMAEAMKASIAQMKGTSGTARMTSRGFSSGVDIKPPKGASGQQAQQVLQQTKDMFTQLAVPLPEEPVGPGAKWEASFKTKSQGMTMDQTSTFELVSIEGEVAKVNTTLSQTAPKQKIENPAMPGMKLELTKMSGKGSGETSVDLTRVLPAAGSMKLKSEVSMAMGASGQPQTMETIIAIDLQFESH